MRSQLKVLIILLTLVFSIFNFSNRMLFQPVNATYVEGAITQDTVWTLANSPFVLSKNVTVYSNATLTIESGVEVQFGGEFSLIVNGRIIANGMNDKMIRFTSNNPIANPGDWGTIIINGALPSSLTYCIIEDGTSGIVLENGALSIQDSSVKNNSENGIAINDGSVILRNCEITDNIMNGVYIAGGAQITVQNNVISSNGDGIFLTGYLEGAISIQQNNIMLNGRSGISLEADAYDNTIIIDNNVTANLDGFRVSTNTATYITRNYISNNSIGIYYESGNNHEAHFNDICMNDVGMDVSPTASADATYNYWGHRSGPFHESLNPHGKGNPVGSDGVDLDFIFFLSEPIDYNNQRPTAILWTDKALVKPNQKVTFVGIDSHDDGRVDKYLFDFGDGSKSGWTTLSLVNHSYSSTGTYIASLTVIDDFNVTNENVATTVIMVQNLTPLDTSIVLSIDIVNSTEQVLVTAYASNATGALANVNVTLFSVNGGSFEPISGLTNSTGHFTAVFTAPNVTEITNVRIIARASEVGYVDGSDYKYLTVLPPLMVQITVEPATVKSEETATVTVNVADSFEEPVADASLAFSVDYGVLSASTGVTDLNGRATFNFTAPQTSSEITVTLVAVATKTGRAEGSAQKAIIVEPKILVVEVTANPSMIVSEASSTITAHVTFNESPILNATVTVSSDSGGNFSALTEITDSNGYARFVFTAPQTTIMDGLNATITATTSKNGYVNGEGYTIIVVKPRVLIVQVVANPNVTVSEGKINVTAHVAYDTANIQDASVTIMLESFSITSGLTDIYGNAVFILTAPQVNAPLNITITARASKAGYIDGENRLNITVNPGILIVEITADSYTITSRASTTVTVYISCNATPVANASITVSSSLGNLSDITGFTNSDGYCKFIFNVPRIIEQSQEIFIMANTTKNGYVSGESQTTITVTPEAGGGLSLTTILLILSPVVIAAIVAVLIKLKIIVLFAKEEEQ